MTDDILNGSDLSAVGTVHSKEPKKKKKKKKT